MSRVEAELRSMLLRAAVSFDLDGIPQCHFLVFNVVGLAQHLLL